MGLRKDVGKTEFIVYVVVWSGAVIYGIYCFAKEADKHFQHYDDLYSDFDQGWSFLPRKKDSGDYEWRQFKWEMKTHFWWIISSTVISEIIRYFHFFHILQFWQITIALAFIIKELESSSLVLILFQPILFILILSVTRNKLAIWATGALSLLLFTLHKDFCITEECPNILRLSNENIAYGTSICVSWMMLRCISYSVYVIDSKEEPKIFKFFAYCLYLPNLVCGPFISFEDFQTCYQFSENLTQRIYDLLKNVLRFSFWFIFAEFWLHFVYVNAVVFHPQWVRSFGLVSLYAYGYTMAQFFHLKYVVMYGVATMFSKFENVQVPSVPACIGRIHLYSDMWRYFDVGLHKFLLRCIYIPLMKSRVIENRLLASLATFIFIYVWHGIQYNIFVWTVLNYFGIVVEYVSKSIHDNFLQKTKLYQKLGPSWCRRISCMAASPLLAMSAISNFYFFAGEEIGNIFTTRTLKAGFSSNAILLAILYTTCQVSTEVKHYQMQNTKCKLKTS